MTQTVNERANEPNKTVKQIFYRLERCILKLQPTVSTMHLLEVVEVFKFKKIKNNKN